MPSKLPHKKEEPRDADHFNVHWARFIKMRHKDISTPHDLSRRKRQIAPMSPHLPPVAFPAFERVLALSLATQKPQALSGEFVPSGYDSTPCFRLRT